MKFFLDLFRATISVCVCCLLIQTVSSAQSTRDRRRNESAPSDQQLAIRLEKVEEALVNEYKEVAEEYYKQGNREKSMEMLQRLKQLNPDLDGLDDRIDSIGEELMQDNAAEFDLDTRKDWQHVANVATDMPFRVAAAGEYKMMLTTTVSVDGVRPNREAKDHVPGVPIGCLIGVITDEDGKPGRPFSVGSQLEMTPKRSGKMFLKVNVPEGTRCVGRIKVRMSGHIQSVSSK